MDEKLLIAFIAVTAAAVVLQTMILAGMYASTRKMGKRMDALSTRMNDQVLPLVEKVRGMVDESAPKVQIVVHNLAETSTLVRTQARQIDEALTEIVGIARKQAGNAGLLAQRTIQRLDATAETVQHTVTSPMRHLTALVEGVAVGVGELVSGRKGRRTKTEPPDDMFV
jgi:hypothetical protein